MDYLGVGAVILGVIAFLGFIWGWGWKIIQDVKKSAHKRMDKIVDEHNELEEKVLQSLGEIKESLADKPTRQMIFEYSDRTFVRKDVHGAEYANLISKISELNEKLDKIVENNKGGEK